MLVSPFLPDLASGRRKLAELCSEGSAQLALPDLSENSIGMPNRQALLIYLLGAFVLATSPRAKDEAPSPQLIRVTVPKMSCSVCVKHISHSLKEIEGSGQVAVFLDPKLAFCEIPYGKPLTVIERKLRAVGYELSHVSKLYDVSFDKATEPWRK